MGPGRDRTPNPGSAVRHSSVARHVTYCATRPGTLLILLKKKALLTLHVMPEMHYFTSENPKKYHAWSCQNVCDVLTFLLDNIFIQLGTKLYREVVGILMGTNCAPLVDDLFLFCYERDFMMSFSDDKQADVIDAFNTTSRDLDDILNINMFILTIW